MKRPNSRRCFPRREGGGFTLVELLAVMAIIAMLSAIVMPSVVSVKSNMELQSCTSELIGQLTLGRQTARTKNCRVEVRFYSESAKDGAVFHAVQLYLVPIDGSDPQPFQKRFNLPEQVNISGNTTFSSLLALCSKTGEDVNGSYRAMEFLSDGTIDSAGSSLPTLTLLPSTLSQVGDQLPAAFATIQIDPRTGRTLYFHP